ncbi:SRPBCC family protein [Microbacterium sp.]|uniref:SRPBCC family protein n=1 Tax=Microbacterium sp. TaxID=51671 RepID=UPI003C76DF50
MTTVLTRASAVIEAPADAAWAVLGDYANDPLWRRAVSRMEQTPPGIVHDGAQAVEELQTLGRTVVTRVELHDVLPGRSFAWRAVDGTDAHGTRAIVPLDDGRCALRTERRIGLTGADRLLQPLVSWVMARAERADLARAAALVLARNGSEVIG